MSELCVDCLAIGSDPPRPREGTSPRCLFHRHTRRAWTSTNRQRKRRGAEPLPYEPTQPGELPETKWLTAAEIRYLDDVVAQIRRAQNPIDNHLRTGGALTRKQLETYAQKVGELTESLTTILWRDRLPPPRPVHARRPRTLHRDSE